MEDTVFLKEDAYDFIEEDKFDAAKQAIDKALKMAPDDISILELYDYWYYANTALSREEKLRGRLRVTDTMLKLDPENIRNIDRKSDYLMGLERYEDALHTCEDAFATEGNGTAYRFEQYIRFLKMAKCQWELGRYSEVLDSCAKIPPAYKYAPHKPYLEAKALLKLNRLEEALKRLSVYLRKKNSTTKAGVAIDPDFTPLWNHEKFKAMTATSDINPEIVKQKQQPTTADQKKR